MPLQNRVTPSGDLVATLARGTLMGNRGRLHNTSQQIMRSFELKRWITCDLSFNGIKRQLMSPNSYTELFFLDEATAYASGHRPCAECRRGAYQYFIKIWQRTFPNEPKPTAQIIDARLHASRLDGNRQKRLWKASLGSLPEGTIIRYKQDYVLLWQKRLWIWSFEGYRLLEERFPLEQEVEVVTPELVVKLFAAGLNATFEIKLPEDKSILQD